MNVLSVDLGTSNTVAVLSAHGRAPRVIEVDSSATMPSAIYADEDGGLVVGRDAERRARLDPSRFEPNPKRRVDEGTLLLGTTVVPVTDALAAVLRRVADETSRQLGGAKPDEVRLTHPAQWGPVRRNVLLSAARQSGLGSNLVLVPEPVAAAAHFASFGHTLAPNQALAVYDLGAGTFDVAIVAATQNGFAVLAENGLPDLGGMDVDQTLLEHVGRQVSHRDPGGWQRLLRPESLADRRARRALLEDVKAAKEALSRHPQTEVPMPEPFDDVLVTRAELEALIRPSMLRSVELLAGTIRATGLSPERLVGIYLVGGSSRIPLVATLIAEQLRVVPTSLDQPETAVALGAHNVSQEGISMRTSQVGPQSGGVQAQPSTGGFPAQQQAAGGFASQHGGQQPASGGFPAQSGAAGSQPPQTGSFAAQQNFPQPTQQANFPNLAGNFPTPPRQPAAAGRKKLVVTAVAAVVALAAIAGGIFYFTRSGELPTAQSCATKGTADDKGFTDCLRQLAGGVPDANTCERGADVTCALPDAYRVTYTHAGSTDDVQRVWETELGKVDAGEHVVADWQGNGLDGKLRAGVKDGVGVLVFTVKDRPLVGTLTKSDAADLSPDKLADFFAANVQPGT
ncbi:Hsp70 protein [Actinokineospora alba]|uniref:Hsp70 protein n=1 Tax=Actinokineospora alba TaxID=504798 RepID=A0A1H0JJX2_9PSEU|nr:Hsp70 family protein [Actinokineospora alba]TDP68271.1 Hsp70 protein [Actinokineospora alba]SDH95597.1 Hsp70 protein [Actinokineospora alba]SDO43729.1 Hsp70 protein [Actinokineospora alba]